MVLLSDARECFDVGSPGEASALGKCGRIVIEVAGAFGRDDEAPSRVPYVTRYMGLVASLRNGGPPTELLRVGP